MPLLQPETNPVSEVDHWRRETFAELSGQIGQEKAKQILGRFRIDLARRFSEPASREGVRRDAHTIKSTAGLLGFKALSERARAVEANCSAGLAFDDPLDALMIVARRVDLSIEEFLQ